VVSSKPLFPFGSVGWRTLTKHVIEQCSDTLEQINRVGYVMEVDQLTGYCSRFGRTFGTVSGVVSNVRGCDTVFLFVNFSKSKHFIHKDVELLGGVRALTEGGSTRD